MKHFVYIVFIFMIISCSGDDDAPNADNSSGLSGTWNLTNVSGGFMGVDADFDKGVIVWVFDEVNKQVKVVNTNSSNVEDILPTGTYPYSTTITDGIKELLVNNRNLGNLEVTTNELVIDEQFRDGFKYTFQR
ncbi:hypothetical protein [Aquimarina sediminis]|uniref:hypothetical protein n=1 Tax=Aquimarina sediminis TaxID=2070536 RepID=UPI000FFEE4EE|nr:hypothetical protein [Aquimarina sediminis]